MDELRFNIDAFRPDTIPMARLAEYMAALAALLGNEESVHFVRLDVGSIELVHKIDSAARAAVDIRIAGLDRGDAPPDVSRAFDTLDRMLANDNAIGNLVDGEKVMVLCFPGRDRPRSKPPEYPTLTQAGTLQGELVKIGGLGDVVPVHLREAGAEGHVHICHANRTVARELAPHLFGTPVRVSGQGRWQRLPGGTWRMVDFIIHALETMDDDTLLDVVARLRQAGASGWRSVEKPLAVLADLRGEADRMQ